MIAKHSVGYLPTGKSTEVVRTVSPKTRLFLKSYLIGKHSFAGFYVEPLNI